MDPYNVPRLPFVILEKEYDSKKHIGGSTAMIPHA